MEYKIKISYAVSTFTLLDSAHITDEECKLALTACSDLNFDRMKSALNQLFSKSSLNPNDNNKIKQKEAFYNKRYKDFKHPKSNDKFKFLTSTN